MTLQSRMQHQATQDVITLLRVWSAGDDTVVDRLLWRDRVHFLTMPAQLMRRILVDHARRRGYLKRGGGAGAPRLEELALISSGCGANWRENTSAI
jgi:hypothetical protein